MTAQTDPLRASLTEQLAAMRDCPVGSLPPALLDVVLDRITPADDRPVDVLRPRDWDELRHQEGAEGRPAPYWAQLWPSGLALADELAARDDLDGRRVLELGCGLGAAAAVAARAGAQIVATDGIPDAVAFAAHNLAINDGTGEVALVDWRDADELVEGAPWDLVVAADVLYLRQNVEALMRLVPRLLDRGGELLLTDPSRAGCRDFLAAARATFSVQSRSDLTRERVSVHALRRR